MKTIDISDWSENLNWNLIGQIEDGVIIKISEGRTLASMFDEHFSDASAAEMTWGVYCVSHATTVERAREEAQVVIDKLNSIGLGNPPLSVWFDIEPFLSDSLDADTLTAITSAFICEFNANKYSCDVYGNYTSLNKLKTGELADYVRYWVSEPGSYECDFKAEHPELKVVGWQYEFDNRDYGGVVDKNEWWE